MTVSDMTDKLQHNDENRFGGELNLFDLLHTLLKRKNIIIIGVIIVMAVTAVKVFLEPDQFRSTATILPTGKTDQLAELKNLAGLGRAGNDENSSELYPTILASRTIKETVLMHEYRIDNKQTSLTEYFGTDNRDRLLDALAGITTVYTDDITGLITISVETANPGLSQDIVKSYLAELEEFNLHKRRSQAKENERYLAGQLQIINGELADAENMLEQFQFANRNWDVTGDPELQKTLNRLKREVAVKSTTFVFLQEQHEAAKLDVQKDMPIVRLLDSPSIPTMKIGPRRKLVIILSGAASLLFLSLAVVAYDSFRRQSRQSQSDALARLQKDMRESFPRSARVLRMIHRRRETAAVNNKRESVRN